MPHPLSRFTPAAALACGVVAALACTTSTVAVLHPVTPSSQLAGTPGPNDKFTCSTIAWVFGTRFKDAKDNGELLAFKINDPKNPTATLEAPIVFADTKTKLTNYVGECPMNGVSSVS